MKLPLEWLKDYVDPGMTPEDLADALTTAGSKAEGVERTDAGPVIELEITTNRPDCLSILGLAREVSAITGRAVREPMAYRDGREPASKAVKKVPVAVEDRKACPLYTARYIEGVRVGPAPDKARRALEGMGTRAISNVVDATNFVLFECGQPLHAFDADRLAGGRIVVRRSRAGEKFLGLDGVEYTLDAGTLVIADAEKPVAIAGVIGGRLTEVTSATKNVLLESAYFDPLEVRRASRRYKVSTESSYRFERGVNPENVARASRRAAELLADWAGGKDVSGLVVKDAGLRPAKATVTLDLGRLAALLGMPVKPARAAAIFRALALEAKAGARTVTVRRTPARRDLAIEEDLVEEVLRVEGFDKIPATLPPTRYAQGDAADRRRPRVPELKRALAAMGFHEIVSYSLLPAKAIADSGLDASAFARVSNAASAEQGYLRASLLPGALAAVAYNANRKATSVKLFEVGKRYSPEAGGREEWALSLALYGALDESWQRRADATFYDLKGAVEETLGAFFRASGFEWRPARAAGFDWGAELLWQGRPIGRAGSVSAEARRRWDVPREVFHAEVALDALLAWEPPTPRARPVPKFPSVRRDIAFVAPESVTVAALEGTMRRAGAPHLHEAQLFDRFTGKGIPEGRRSLAFSLSYRKDDGTFTDEEIVALQARVGEALRAEHGVEFR